MVRRVLAHPLFGPGLAIAAFGWGSLVVLFLIVGPGLGPWADTLLTACFGWNAETRRYRLDTLILGLLQPPLLVGVLALFYADELRAFLRSRAGRAIGFVAPGVFVGLAAYLLATGEVSASGTPPNPAALPAPIRQGSPAPPFRLVSHRGEVVTAEGLRGAPVALTFVYAGCHASCPVLLARLKALDAREPGDVLFLAVTLDPERDTPAALAAHAVRWGLGRRSERNARRGGSSSAWGGLPGRTASVVRALAKAAAAGYSWSVASAFPRSWWQEGPPEWVTSRRARVPASPTRDCHPCSTSHHVRIRCAAAWPVRNGATAATPAPPWALFARRPAPPAGASTTSVPGSKR